MVDIPQLTPRVAPQNQRGAQSVPTIRREQVVDLRRIPSVRPTGLEAEARALNVKADVLGQMERQFQISAEESLQEIRTEQQVEAERIYSEKRLELEGLFSGLETDPNANGGDLTGATLGVYDAVVEDALNNTKSDFQRRILKSKFDNQRANVGTRAIQKQARRELAEREVDFARKLQANQTLVSASPETHEEVLQEQLQAIQELPIAPEQAAAIQAEVREGLAVSKVKGLLTQNPDAAAEALADETFSQDLSAEALTVAEEDVARAQEKEQQAATTQAKIQQSETYQALTDKAQAGELTKTEINDAVEGDLVSPEQKAALDEEVEKEAEVAVVRQQEAQEVADALNGLDVVTGADTRKVNSAYKDTYAPRYAQMNPQDAMLAKAHFVGTTNKIPTLMAQELKGALGGGSPERKIEAARQVQLIRDRSPFAAANSRDLSATTQAQADRILDMLEAGVSEDEVIQTLEKQDSQINQATSEIRRSQFKEEFDQGRAVDVAVDAFDTFLPFDEPDVAVETGTEQRVLADMRIHAERYYLDNPDMKAAMKYAQDRIKRQYGVTRTGGGGRRLMKFAPETFYNVDGETKWIEQQMVRDVQTLVPGIEAENIFLVPDRKTSREAAEGTPAYTLMIKNEDGTLQTLPQRWQPDVEAQKTIARDARIARAREKFEKEKAAANRRIAFRRGMAESDGRVRSEDLERAARRVQELEDRFSGE